MPLGQDLAACMRRLWGNCYFSSSHFYLLFLSFHFHFSSKVIPVIRFCCSCFQSGWTEAINTWDNPTAVSNWISFFSLGKPYSYWIGIRNELEVKQFPDWCTFLFSRWDSRPPEQWELHATHTKVEPSLVAVSRKMFSELIHSAAYISITHLFQLLDALSGG